MTTVDQIGILLMVNMMDNNRVATQSSDIYKQNDRSIRLQNRRALIDQLTK
jgi:hypothetical protein